MKSWLTNKAIFIVSNLQFLYAWCPQAFGVNSDYLFQFSHHVLCNSYRVMNNFRYIYLTYRSSGTSLFYAFVRFALSVGLQFRDDLCETILVGLPWYRLGAFCDEQMLWKEWLEGLLISIAYSFLSLSSCFVST